MCLRTMTFSVHVESTGCGCQGVRTSVYDDGTWTALVVEKNGHQMYKRIPTKNVTDGLLRELKEGVKKDLLEALENV